MRKVALDPTDGKHTVVILFIEISTDPRFLPLLPLPIKLYTRTQASQHTLPSHTFKTSQPSLRSKDLGAIDPSQSADTDKVSLLTLGAGALGFLAMDFGEHGLQAGLERLVLGALVELADEVAADFEGGVAEI
jgi:hypothetical protein